jgi:uncharacterized membrane protein YeaQ/YmgE (transglycosylase-associated protein family)
MLNLTIIQTTDWKIAVDKILLPQQKSTTMGILTWIVFGLIAGAVAKWVMPGSDPGGWIVTILIGIVGAMLGGWIGTMLGIGQVTGFNLGSLLIAIGGSVVLLWLYRVVTRRKA